MRALLQPLLVVPLFSVPQSFSWLALTAWQVVDQKMSRTTKVVAAPIQVCMRCGCASSVDSCRMDFAVLLSCIVQNFPQSFFVNLSTQKSFFPPLIPISGAPKNEARSSPDGGAGQPETDSSPQPKSQLRKAIFSHYLFQYLSVSR